MSSEKLCLTFPADHSSALSLALHEELAARIQHEGSLSVAAYMEACLTHPRFGYYMARDPFGAAGDFTTAPDISQMFGEILGAWFADVWVKLGAPAPFHLIECGPGRGTLMADMLRVMARMPGLLDAARIHLIECSPLLKEKQQAALAACGARVTWHGHIASVPAGPFLLVANEFLDALPIKQFVYTNQAWRERRIGSAEGALRFVEGDRADVSAAGREGAVLERSPARDEFVAGLAHRVQRDEGAALLIDYGYAAAPAEIVLGDTLQAVRAHGYVDVLAQPGTCDITAHVDFAALQQRALAEGCGVQGPVSQGFFLNQLGIEARAAKLAAKNPHVMRDLHRLTAASEMGDMFKVMALRAGGVPELAGF